MEITTEIRDFGDKQTVVLYTNDRAIATALSESRKCFKVIPYEHEQHKNNRNVLAGIDLYFPKKSQGWLERQVLRTGKITKSKKRGVKQ